MAGDPSARQGLVIQPVEGRGPRGRVDADHAPGVATGHLGGEITAVQLREVTDETTLTEFVRTAVHRAATSDGIALLHAHRAARDHDLERAVAADNALYQRKFTEEARTMSVRMGRKLGELGATMAGAPAIAGWLRLVQESQTPGTYPVGLGLLFADLDVREEHAFAVHQYGVAMMMMSAALRLMKIDHRQAQAGIEIHPQAAHEGPGLTKICSLIGRLDV